jgi:hypothetical protein
MTIVNFIFVEGNKYIFSSTILQSQKITLGRPNVLIVYGNMMEGIL